MCSDFVSCGGQRGHFSSSWVLLVMLMMDREAWHAAVHGVTKSWTRLSDWTELNLMILVLLGWGPDFESQRSPHVPRSAVTSPAFNIFLIKTFHQAHLCCPPRCLHASVLATLLNLAVRSIWWTCRALVLVTWPILKRINPMRCLGSVMLTVTWLVTPQRGTQKPEGRRAIPFSSHERPPEASQLGLERWREFTRKGGRFQAEGVDFGETTVS